jgi:hypothetical protein
LPIGASPGPVKSAVAFVPLQNAHFPTANRSLTEYNADGPDSGGGLELSRNCYEIAAKLFCCFEARPGENEHADESLVSQR